MSSISSRQNEEPQIERIAAARELYSAAKRRHVLQIFINVIIPVIFGTIVLIKDDLSAYFALYGLLVIIFDSAFLSPSIDSLRERAAKIQELFDCYVLKMDESPLKTAKPISIEDVLQYFHAHSRIQSNIDKLRDWYPKAVDALPLSIGRILCQRENLKWDLRQRELYAIGYKWVLFIVATSAITIGLLVDISFSNMILALGGFSPLFQFCIGQYLEQVQTCNRLGEISEYAESLWKAFLEENLSDDEKLRKSRDLQNEIFDHRSKNPLVFDWVYERLRSKNERLLGTSSNRLIQEALEKMAIKNTNVNR